MERKDELHTINQILSGKTELYAMLVDRYSHSIYTLIVQIVNCSEDAEELVQDTFMKAFKSLNRFKGDSGFLTWLYRIAYHTAISATRKRKQEYVYIDDKTINQVSESLAINIIDEASETEACIAQLMNAINKLLPEEKAIITLFYLDEKRVDEVGQIVGITATNVKVKLHRIRKKIYLLMTSTYE